MGIFHIFLKSWNKRCFVSEKKNCSVKQKASRFILNCLSQCTVKTKHREDYVVENSFSGRFLNFFFFLKKNFCTLVDENGAGIFLSLGIHCYISNTCFNSPQVRGRHQIKCTKEMTFIWCFSLLLQSIFVSWGALFLFLIYYVKFIPFSILTFHYLGIGTFFRAQCLFFHFCPLKNLCLAKYTIYGKPLPVFNAIVLQGGH